MLSNAINLINLTLDTMSNTVQVVNTVSKSINRVANAVDTYAELGEDLAKHNADQIRASLPKSVTDL